MQRSLEALKPSLQPCVLCPRECKVERQKKLGRCGVGLSPKIAGYEPHFGEEACLVGRNGSGAIFFSGCNLGCVFCQTYEISQEGLGQEITSEELAQIMLKLQEEGCHNINLVTPSHQIWAILKALEQALTQGLTLPIVFNTGGYDKLETIKALEGVVDIYLADFKVWSEETAEKYLKARDYPRVARKALKEMYRQVGNLIYDEQGLAKRGLIVRHLVLPHGLGETEKILRFIKEELSPEIHLNLMGHYHPAGRALEYPPLDRHLKRAEYEEALNMAADLGLKNLDQTHRPLLELILT